MYHNQPPAKRQKTAPTTTPPVVATLSDGEVLSYSISGRDFYFSITSNAFLSESLFSGFAFSFEETIKKAG